MEREKIEYVYYSRLYVFLIGKNAERSQANKKREARQS